jgi:hypothetical protein
MKFSQIADHYFTRDFTPPRHGHPSGGNQSAKVHALVDGRSRNRVEVLELLDTAHRLPAAIPLILDNHWARISAEARAWVSGEPAGHFEFAFSPSLAHRYPS